MEAGAIHWMMFLKGIWIKRPSFKDFWIVWFFHFFPENISFTHLAGILAMNPHGSCLCAFQCWKPEIFMEYHCSEEPWETSGSDIPSDCLVSGLEVASPQGRPREGWRHTCYPAAQLPAETTDEAGFVLMCQAGIWSSRGSHMSHVASLVTGAALVWGKAESATFDSLSSWPLSGVSWQLAVGKIFQTSPFELLIGKW